MALLPLIMFTNTQFYYRLIEDKFLTPLCNLDSLKRKEEVMLFIQQQGFWGVSCQVCS